MIPTNNPDKFDKLRQQAEACLKERPSSSDALTDLDAILHELQVHQVELEMQNEELRQSQGELAASRDQYLKLYDFAPVGYVTLDNKGVILSANLTFANLLGVERKLLIGRLFSRFVASESQDFYFHHWRQAFQSGEQQQHELHMRDHLGNAFYALLDSQVTVMGEDGIAQCLTAVTDLTPYKKMEAARWETERKFSQLVQLARAGMYEYDFTAGKLAHVNDYMCDFTGYSREELLAINPLKLLTPSSRKVFQNHINKVAAGERIEPVVEYEYQRKDGRIGWGLFNQNFIYKDGRPAKAVVIAQDITRRKRAEVALQHANAELELVMRSVASYLWSREIDAQGKVTYDYISPVVEKITGRPKSFFLADTDAWVSIIHADDRQRMLQLTSNAAVSQQNYAAGEYRIFHTNGDLRWLRDSVMIRPLPNGGIRFDGVTTDITTRKNTEAELLQLSAVMDMLVDGVTITDLTGKINYVNQALINQVGYTEVELIGQTPHLFIDDQDFLKLERHLHNVVTDGSMPERSEYLIRHKQGVKIPMSVSYTPLPNPNGQITKIAAVSRDLTERVRAEEALQKYARRLESLNQIDKAILSAQSPAAIARAVLEQLNKLFPFSSSDVGLINFDTQEMTTLAVYPDTLKTFRPGTRTTLRDWGAILHAIQQEREHLILDVNEIAATSPAAEKLKKMGIVSILLLPLIIQDKLIGSVIIGVDQQHTFTADQIEVCREAVDTLAVALQQTRSREALQELNTRLRALAARLAEAEEAERQRLARDLHDLVGQNLSVLGLNLTILKNQLPPELSDTLLTRLNDSMSLVEETSKNIRGVMSDLHPPALDDYGLAAALRWYGNQFATRTGMDVLVEGDTFFPRLTAHTEISLFRIASEALTNAAKHSQVTEVKIKIQSNGKTALLEIVDEGVGFDPNRLTSSGWGLRMIAERAEAINGRCHITSQPEKGTKITVEVTHETGYKSI